MLVLKNITKKFGTKTVLNAVSLDVKHGEIALLLGHSGVGKSTLLRILNNLETFDQGSIMLDGRDLDVATIHKEHIVGMVFQQFNLFEHLSVIENITLVLEKSLGMSTTQAHEKALNLLDVYGLKDLANAKIQDLSGGQKQRLALARTLSLGPKILCLDEPTSALDPALTMYVVNVLKKLADQGYIVLVSSHDTLLIEKLNCTIYLMNNGEIVTKVLSQDYRTNPNQYQALQRFVSGSSESQ